MRNGWCMYCGAPAIVGEDQKGPTFRTTVEPRIHDPKYLADTKADVAEMVKEMRRLNWDSEEAADRVVDMVLKRYRPDIYEEVTRG